MKVLRQKLAQAMNDIFMLNRKDEDLSKRLQKFIKQEKNAVDMNETSGGPNEDLISKIADRDDSIEAEVL